MPGGFESPAAKDGVMSERPFLFFASEFSYFSGKVRPAFRIKRIFFEERLPTRDSYRVMKERTGYQFLPTVITPEDEAWQDSSDILDKLEARHPVPPLYPRTPVQKVVAYLFELYADEFLIIPGLHYRWSFPESAAGARQDFAASNGDPARAAVFADTVSKQFAPLAGVLPETVPALEAHVHELLAAMEAHLAEHRFVLGDAPSLADCSLMGPMYPHWYLDVVPGRLLRETAPRSCHWIQVMNHPNPDSFGGWLEGDALAKTLRPILELIGSDAVPLLADAVAAVDEWADANAQAGPLPPRVVGMHSTELRGIRFSRYTGPYTSWMVQRVVDAYSVLDDGGRSAVDAALAGTGCEMLFRRAPRHRFGKRGFDLAFAQ